MARNMYDGEIKISIIIAFYNEEIYISRCLNSVLNQCINDIEIILIDDGSTDDSYSVIKNEYSGDERIIYIKRPHQGAGLSRNYGINVSRGKYLAFMDADDYYPNSDCLQKMYDAAERNHALIVGGSVVRNTNGTCTSDYAAGSGNLHSVKNGFVDYKDNHYMYGHTRYLYDSELIKANHISFAGYKRFEDQVFVVKALGEAKRFYELDYPVYEVFTDGKTRNWDFSVYLDIFRGFADTIELVLQYEMSFMFEENYMPFIEYFADIVCRYGYGYSAEFEEILERISTIGKKYKEKDGSAKRIYDFYEYIESCKESRRHLLVYLSDPNVFFYGAGKKLYELLNCFRKEISGVRGIIDSDPAREGEVIEGLPVMSLSDSLHICENPLILITTGKDKYGEIMQKCRAQGISRIEWEDVYKAVRTKEMLDELSSRNCLEVNI